MKFKRGDIVVSICDQKTKSLKNYIEKDYIDRIYNAVPNNGLFFNYDGQGYYPFENFRHATDIEIEEFKKHGPHVLKKPKNRDFKVGDLVIGNNQNTYLTTSKGCVCVVKDIIGGRCIRVSVEKYKFDDIFTVEKRYFDLYKKKETLLTSETSKEMPAYIGDSFQGIPQISDVSTILSPIIDPMINVIESYSALWSKNILENTDDGIKHQEPIILKHKKLNKNKLKTI